MLTRGDTVCSTFSVKAFILGCVGREAGFSAARIAACATTWTCGRKRGGEWGLLSLFCLDFATGDAGSSKCSAARDRALVTRAAASALCLAPSGSSSPLEAAGPVVRGAVLGVRRLRTRPSPSMWEGGLAVKLAVKLADGLAGFRPRISSLRSALTTRRRRLVSGSSEALMTGASSLRILPRVLASFRAPSSTRLLVRSGSTRLRMRLTTTVGTTDSERL